jgi:hypothetical protein
MMMRSVVRDPSATSAYDGVTCSAGANVQADSRSQMGGIEALWSSPIGTLGGSIAVSHLVDRGMGYAAVFTLQRLIRRDNAAADALNLFFDPQPQLWRAWDCRSR